MSVFISRKAAWMCLCGSACARWAIDEYAIGPYATTIVGSSNDDERAHATTTKGIFIVVHAADDDKVDKKRRGDEWPAHSLELTHSLTQRGRARGSCRPALCSRPATTVDAML